MTTYGAGLSSFGGSVSRTAQYETAPAPMASGSAVAFAGNSGVGNDEIERLRQSLFRKVLHG